MTNNQQNAETSLRLNKNLTTPQERIALVEQIIAASDPDRLTSQYLEVLSDYILEVAKDKEDKSLLTNNRMVTVKNRETSFEGLISKFENGEDGIYNLIANDKNIIFKPKVEITEKDIAEIPGLKDQLAAIEELEKELKTATGRRKFLIKQNLIEMHKDKIVIRNEYHQPIYRQNTIKNFANLDLSEHIEITGDLEPTAAHDLVDLFNPSHISALLCNYSTLKEECWGRFQSDGYYLMEDLDKLIQSALKDYPLYEELVLLKIDGRSNAEIQQTIQEHHGIKHSVEYLSSLWRNKIPKIIAEKAKEEYLDWYFTYKDYGKWKRCSRCGEVKLAHNRFFSKNKTSKDHFYSICKKCRNKESKKVKK